ncbi:MULTISPECIES: isopenicillin N synthase family dioxygenase [Sphingomonadales]|uniref:2-oxoglutarate-dependent ethylene/succinate-forming enzyme n=1 Tax=Sphingopyxis macrogoltabida TaxID=33050 RepID=A0AAC8YYB9_SPHMC|nr:MULTISPECIES: 2-oxoglutarate and iron-dependent oxygenase domain-containing protein [Sphingomonadaceae]ALJ12328.1 penicillin synthase [Sphingopyxis macrogoltabida]AMU88495.1 penicillin synthase [Sphingopyxis macrogoltabida]MBF5088857.1 isopenicillin N synthase family oxygenase [Novosphingobium sp. NBM11]
MIVYTPPKPATTIPVIDLAPSFSDDPALKRAVAWEIHKSARDTGFFYIANHGVAQELMDGQLALARDFFSLPLAEKLAVDARKSACMRGYEVPGIQTLDDGSPPDLKEGFLIGCDLDDDHPYVRDGVPNCGANQWPSKPDGFRRRYEAYMDEMFRVGRHLMGLIALSLDLPETYFADGLAEPLFNSRLLRYAPQPETAAFNQIGAGAHTDWGMITILLQDDVGGLEVENAAGEWIAAPAIPGTFVINLGEMVRVLTNGLYHANMHRVLNNHSGRDRFSVPTFFDPNYFYEVRCAPTCLPAGGKPDFQETTVGGHIAEMYRKTYGLAA